MNITITDSIMKLIDDLHNLEHELFISLPFARSQAHVRGNCDRWIDQEEEKVLEQREKIENKIDRLRQYHGRSIDWELN